MIEYIKQNWVTIIIFSLLIGYLLYQRIPVYISNSKLASKPLKNLNLVDINGKSHHLFDYSDKTIVINFWATWCAPCKIEMPILESTYQELNSSGLEIIGITYEDKQTVMEFLKDKNISYIIGLDPDYVWTDFFEIMGYPTIIIIKDKKIVDVSTGLSVFLKYKIRWYVKKSIF